MIVDAKLNALVANQKAEKIVKQLLELSPDSFVDVPTEMGVRLTKVVLRCSAFGHPANKPFYAFAKNFASLVILVDIQSGKGEVFDGSTVAGCVGVTGPFSIKGVRYALKDTVNGFNRYHAIADETCPRKKSSIKHQLLQETLES